MTHGHPISKRRVWIGVGVGIALLMLCCVGALYAPNLIQSRQATRTVEVYLGATLDGSSFFAKARLCPPGVSDEELASRTTSTGFTGYRLGKVDLGDYYTEVSAILSTPRGKVRQLYVVGSVVSARGGRRERRSCIVDIRAG